jgi:hypothetical protein
MSTHRQDAVLLAILTSVMAMPAWGQAVGSATGAPDFSGIWAHISFPGFEPPLAGPGPVTNKKRAPDGGPTVSAWVGDYTNPILKPEAAEIVKRRGAIEASGVHAPSPRSYCWPGGVPFVTRAARTRPEAPRSFQQLISTASSALRA